LVSEKKKFDGKVLRIADCVVGDDKGCVKLTAKDAHIDIVNEGDTITLMNAHVRVNQNYLKIELDKWSLVKKAK
jgi:replication factor A1